MKSESIFCLLLVVTVGVSLPAAFCTPNSITVHYQFTPAMEDCSCSGCNFWELENTTLREIPGEPIIPYRTASILLPQNAEVSQVKVTHGPPLIEKGIDMTWGQPPCILGSTTENVDKSEKVYGSNGDYPGTFFEVNSVQSFRGYTIVYVNLFPVQYKPQSRTVKFYEQLTVIVTYQYTRENTLYRGLKADKERVSQMVNNPEIVATYADQAVPLVQSEEYIIITSEDLKDSFLSLVNHKSGYVDGAKIYLTPWIYSNYQGTDNAEKIRNFIKDKYQNNGLQWCLLGGDVDVVPYRGFYAEVITGPFTKVVDNDMAADMYFGCLDGNFDADGDGVYGEVNDNVDWLEEVFVGRAPVENQMEASMFTSKVIAYEHSEKPEKIQFHQARLRNGNIPDSRCLAWKCDDYVPPGYTLNYLFEENGTVTKEAWSNAWAGNPLIVEHCGHGSTASYQINFENGGPVTWADTDMFWLQNTFYPLHTSMACLSGQFEANDCLAEAYIKDDHGAIACYMNDNYGWFSTADACKYSGEFVEKQFEALFIDGKEQFGELLNQSKSYLAGSAAGTAVYRWCYYEINLLGDPETPCLTKRGGEHGGSLFNGHEYKVFAENKTWQQARQHCESLGGHLVTITSSEENDFVDVLAWSYYVWIGFTDEETEGTWKWITGEDVTFTNWSMGEPNDCCGGEDYGEMEPDGTWNDLGGPGYPNMGRSYVCEWEAHGGILYNGHEYRLFTTSKTWEEAQEHCESLGGHLVTISNAGENDFVHFLANGMGVWIGFTDEETEGVWQWITGEDVIFTNWSTGEPNDCCGGEDYGEMKPDGTWNDLGGPGSPDTLSCYICEWDS